MPRKIIDLAGGPLDGYPMIGSGELQELHIPFTDEMVRLADAKMTAESLDQRTIITQRKLATARGVAIYVKQKEEPVAAGGDTAGLPGVSKVTYAFRENVSPEEYRQRFGVPHR